MQEVGELNRQVWQLEEKCHRVNMQLMEQGACRRFTARVDNLFSDLLANLNDKNLTKEDVQRVIEIRRFQFLQTRSELDQALSEIALLRERGVGGSSTPSAAEESEDSAAESRRI